MPKKSTTKQPPKSVNLPVAYHLGFAGHYYLRMAASFWRTASVEDPPPIYLESLFTDFKNALLFVTTTIELMDAQSADRLAKAAEKFRLRFENAWGGRLHRNGIKQRDQSEPEGFDPAEMLVGSPLESAEFRDLEAALADFINSLPKPEKRWACLGSKVAEVLDPIEAGEPGSKAIPAFLLQVSPLSRHRLMRNFPRVAHCSKESVLQLHDRLLAASKTILWEASPANAPQIASGRTISSVLGVSLDAAAVAVFSDNREIPMTTLAQRLGINRTTLYRLTQLEIAREQHETARLQRLPGFVTRTADGQRTVDRVDEHDHTDPVSGQE